MTELQVIVAAVLLDIIFGDPMGIPHPIIWVGKLISKLEKIIRKNMKRLKVGGAFLLFLTIGIVTSLIRIISIVSGELGPLFYDLVTVYILYTSLASTCLSKEAQKVYRALLRKDIKDSREKIGYLVGRDTKNLNYRDIRRATVETVAENTIDGVLAPLFFIAIGFYIGYPAELAYLYKSVNTLDSMVGYKNERYGEIGYFSAKADDLLNYIPARLGALIMVLSGRLRGYSFLNGLRITIRDRKNHKSPNCAYPEGAIAGLLGIELGGSNVYFGKLVYKPSIGEKTRDIEDIDIKRTVSIMYISFILSTLLVIFLMSLN